MIKTRLPYVKPRGFLVSVSVVGNPPKNAGSVVNGAIFTVGVVFESKVYGRVLWSIMIDFLLSTRYQPQHDKLNDG